MSISKTVKNYYPPKFISFRPTKDSSTTNANTTQPLQPQRHDIQNRVEKANETTAHPMKRSSIISTTYAPSITNYSTNSQQLSKPQQNKSNLLLVIDSYERRIKDFMKQAAGLMEILLSNKAKLILNQKEQEKIRMLDEKNIEKQYLLLKEQLTAFRRQTLFQQFVQKKSNSINPQVTCQKHKKMHLQKVIAMTINPAVHTQRERSNSAKKHDYSLACPPKDRNSHHIQELGHHLDHMTKRAQHYKHKFLKLQCSIEGILKTKQQTDRINEQMGEQIVKLRAQTLSYKYRFPCN